MIEAKSAKAEKYYPAIFSPSPPPSKENFKVDILLHFP
jgi:hypothetical protein